MSGIIRVITKRPNEDPRVEDIRSDPDSFKRIIGGDFGGWRFAPNLWLIFHDEGRLSSLEPNIFMARIGIVVGPVIFARADERGDHIDLRDGDIREIFSMLDQSDFPVAQQSKARFFRD